MSLLTDFFYTTDHEWVKIDGEVATVGITNHAQEELTDIVFVELPEVGTNYTSGDPCAVVESVKVASDIYTPVSGEIVEVNDQLTDEPALINTDPHGEGWIFKLKLSAIEEIDHLMKSEAYKEFTGS